MNDQNDDRPASEPSGNAAEQAKAQAERAREYVMGFEMPQRLLLLGSGAALLFGIFPWWSVRSPFGGGSINGFQGWGWLYFVSAAVTILLVTMPTVRQPLIGSLPADKQRLVFFGLSCATLLFGPLRFLLGGGAPQSDVAGGEALGFSVGKTMWLWCALIAAGVAVAGGVKLLAANSRSGAE